MDTSFILGMGKVGDDVKILLSIDEVMTNAEISEITSRVNGNPATYAQSS